MNAELMRDAFRSMDPRELADFLLFSLLASDAEALELTPVHGGRHMVSLTLRRGPMGCQDLPSDLADAVAARVALIAGLDFTSGEDRHGHILTSVEGTTHTLQVALSARGGHLSVELRKPVPVRPYQRDCQLSRPAVVGEYELLAELGRGALGVVFRVRHRLLEIGDGDFGDCQ